MNAYSTSTSPEFDVVIVGAGFSGLYMLHRVRELGLSVRVFDRADDVGGTWYWNRYPGARCDVESVDYSYSFDSALEDEWQWSERYPAQPELLRYLAHVADRFDLRRDICFNTAVTAAAYDEAVRRWSVRTSDGQRCTAGVLIMAVGNLSTVKRPDFPGLDSFAGDWYHTAQWPSDGVDFTGKRVGVIGTGSTGIQTIPAVASAAAHLHVFQRTANFVVPAQNRPLDGDALKAVKADYKNRRQLSRESRSGLPGTHPSVAPKRSALDATDEELQQAFDAGWQRGGPPGVMYSFNDLGTDIAANEKAADYVRGKIAEIVHDPQTAQRLMPHDHPIGTKRICVDTGYYETFNRDNVTLVDVRADPIRSITPTGIATDSAQYDLDAIVFAIGFDAITGGLNEIDIRGRGDVALAEKWSAGPRTYLGLASAGFPNLFMITGPGSPSVLSNMVVSIEQHVEWIASCLERLRADGFDTIEASPEAEDAWVEHVNDLAARTLHHRAASWYLGANIPGKPRVFMPYVGGVGTYREECDAVAAAGYEGFERSAGRDAAALTV